MPPGGAHGLVGRILNYSVDNEPELSKIYKLGPNWSHDQLARFNIGGGTWRCPSSRSSGLGLPRNGAGLGVAVHARGGDVPTQGKSSTRSGRGIMSTPHYQRSGLQGKRPGRTGSSTRAFPLATGSGRPAARRRRQDRW